MPPRKTSSKSRSKKAQLTEADVQEHLDEGSREEQRKTEVTIEQTQADTSNPSPQETASGSEESTGGSGTASSEPSSQTLSMEERADKLKALRLKMVLPVHFCNWRG